MKNNCTILYSDFLYCRLQAIIWSSSGLNTPYRLDINSGKLLADIYSNDNIDLPLVVNCKGIIDIIDHGFSFIFDEINNLKRPILFIYASELGKVLHALHAEYEVVLNFSEPNKSSIFFTDTTINCESIYQQVSQVENRYLTKIVTDSYEPYEENKTFRLPSTPFISNGLYNASNIISNPKSFTWISIFLADQVKLLLESCNKDIPNIRLISVSLRSSPFAAAIGLLTQIEFFVIDHFGPKNKIFDLQDIDNMFWDEYKDYIYIGDFLFGGTEVKIAQSFATFTGSKLDKAVVIGSLFPNEVFADCFNLKSLISLKGLNINAKIGLFEEEIKWNH